MEYVISYISYEEALTVYQKTIEKSGGGMSGIRDEGRISATLEFVKNDVYYPTYADKLSYLVYSFCRGHFFDDGNKRIALTLGVRFLLNNGYDWEACTFMYKFEAIIYHVAASRIEQELFRGLIDCFLEGRDFDEDLMLELARAIEE